MGGWWSRFQAISSSRVIDFFVSKWTILYQLDLDAHISWATFRLSLLSKKKLKKNFNGIRPNKKCLFLFHMGCFCSMSLLEIIWRATGSILFMKRQLIAVFKMSVYFIFFPVLIDISGLRGYKLGICSFPLLRFMSFLDIKTFKVKTFSKIPHHSRLTVIIRNSQYVHGINEYDKNKKILKLCKIPIHLLADRDMTRLLPLSSITFIHRFMYSRSATQAPTFR